MLAIDSTQTAKNLALCIAEKWDLGGTFGNIPIAMREAKNGYAVTGTCGPSICLLADVTALPDGRAKSVIYISALPFGLGAFVDNAKACQ